MSTINNLNDNIVALNATVAAAVAKLAQPSGVPETDVQAAADAVGAANTALSAAVNPPTA